MEKLYNELSHTNIDKDKLNDILSLGYTTDDIRFMVRRTSVFLTNPISSIRNKIDNLLKLGFTYDDVIKMTRICPQIFTLSTDKVNDKVKYILSLGFTMEEVIHISKLFPVICSYSIKRIDDKIKYIMSFGYTLSNVRDMIKNYPSILSMSIENLQGKIEFYKSINLSDIVISDTKELMISLSIIYSRYMFYRDIGINIDRSNYALLFIRNKDFERRYKISKEELLKRYCNSEMLHDKDDSKDKVSFKYDKIFMIKKMPPILCISMDNIINKINDLISLGFTKEDVINIIKSFPSVLGLKINNIKNKIDSIVKLGYSYDEVIFMMKNLPSLFGYTIENIIDKIEFYNLIGLHDLFIKYPKKLMMSLDLAYARYRFYKDIGIIIDTSNYSKLFHSNKQFYDRFGIEKEELIKRYKYEKGIKDERRI